MEENETQTKHLTPEDKDVATEDADLEQNEPLTTPSYPRTDLEKGLVGWDSEADPENPLNWPKWKKGYLILVMAIISTLSPMASSMVAPGTANTMKELNEPSQVVGSLMVTIYVLGYAIGPLFLAPLSEIYGRYPVVILSTWFFNAWLLGSALAPTMPSLIAMRLLAGIGGSAVMTISPAVAADLYPVEKRAFTTSLIILSQCVGPALGPICGGFISQGLGWRWLYWILLIASGLITAIMTLYMPESYHPKVLQVKAKRLGKETGRDDLEPLLSLKMSGIQLLATSLVRPSKLLTRSAIAAAICTYVATIYGILYLMFTTIPDVFHNTYGWDLSLTGLAYTGLGIGMIIALLIIMKTNDATVVKLMKKNNGKFEPEMRLPTTVYYTIFVPISLFWYGWTVEKKVHWIVPIIGMVPFGFGMLGIFLPCQTYLVDAFSTYAASAVATVRIGLSIIGAFLPLVGPPLYKALGLGLGNTVLGLIALFMTPIPILFYKYGKMIRERYPVAL